MDIGPPDVGRPETSMTTPRAPRNPALETAGHTALAMLAFAANSLLCRAALAGGHADATSFTALRVGPVQLRQNVGLHHAV